MVSGGWYGASLAKCDRRERAWDMRRSRGRGGGNVTHRRVEEGLTGGAAIPGCWGGRAPPGGAAPVGVVGVVAALLFEPFVVCTG